MLAGCTTRFYQCGKLFFLKSCGQPQTLLQNRWEGMNWIESFLFSLYLSKTICWLYLLTTSSKLLPALATASWASLWRNWKMSVVLTRISASPTRSPAFSAKLPPFTWNDFELIYFRSFNWRHRQKFAIRSPFKNQQLNNVWVNVSNIDRKNT